MENKCPDQAVQFSSVVNAMQDLTDKTDGSQTKYNKEISRDCELPNEDAKQILKIS